MLKDPEYISLPDLRNGLGIAAHISCLIEMNKREEISDSYLIAELQKNSAAFKSSIKKLTQNKK